MCKESAAANLLCNDVSATGHCPKEAGMPSVSRDDGTPSGFVPQMPFGVRGFGIAGAVLGGNGIIGSAGLSSGIAGFTLADSSRAAGVVGAGP